MCNIIDDILVFSKLEDHHKTLDPAPRQLHDNGLTINLSKCEFYQTTIQFSGYISVIPTDWNLAIILPLWKGKGSKSDCTKYRGPISLLSVPAKVFAHICLARMKRTIFAKQRPQQSGFTSTFDRIVALRLLAERRLCIPPTTISRFGAYIDLKKGKKKR